MTPAEQLFLELVNRARLDPLAEAARFGIDLNQGISGPALTGAARQPLASNAALASAAAAHSQWMLDTNTFSHTGAGASSPTQRIQGALALTPPWQTGENLSWTGTTGTINLQSAIPAQHRALFESPGHRQNILREGFDEIGIAQLRGNFTAQSGTTFDTSMVTNKFVGQAGTRFLTGVIFDDTDLNGFYSIGEGRGGITISASGQSVTSAAAGGFAVALAAAQVTVVFGSGPGALGVQVDLSGGNVKLDLVNGLRILSSGNLVLGDGVIEAGLLGVADLSLTGNGLDNVLLVGRGNNWLDGGGGNNTAVFSGAKADYVITLDAGVITVSDLRGGVVGQGVNTLINIHSLRFSDTVVSAPVPPVPEPLPDSLQLLAGVVRGVAGGALRGTEVAFFASGSAAAGPAAVSDGDGSFTLQAAAGLAGRIDGLRVYDQTVDGRPGALDALEILRMAVGLVPSFGPAGPKAFIAADMNGDGRVDATDALAVLRTAVGLPSPHEPRWIFVDADSLPAMGRNSVAFASGIGLDALLADQGGLQLTGILTGFMHEFA